MSEHDPYGARRIADGLHVPPVPLEERPKPALRELVLNVTGEYRYRTYSSRGSWVSRVWFEEHSEGVELGFIVDGPGSNRKCRLTRDEARELRDYLSAILDPDCSVR